MALTQAEYDAIIARRNNATKAKPKVDVPSAAKRGLRTSSSAILAGQGPSAEEEEAWAMASSEDGFWDKVVGGAANIAGGIPAYALGAQIGGVAGGGTGAVAGSVFPGLGTAAGAAGGAAIGASAGAFALDGAVKGAWSGYNELRRSDPKFKDKSFGEIVELASTGELVKSLAGSSISEAAKSGVIGALVGVVPYAGALKKTPIWGATANSRAGQWFTTATKGALNTPAGHKALEFGAELGILSIAPAAFEGTWPGWTDVAANAALLGAFKVAFKNKSIAEKTKELADRGVTVDEVLADLTPEQLDELKAMPRHEFEKTLDMYMERRLEESNAIKEEGAFKGKVLDVEEGIKRVSEERLQPREAEEALESKSLEKRKAAEEKYSEQRKADAQKEADAIEAARAKAKEPVSVDEYVSASPEYKKYASPLLKRVQEIRDQISKSLVGDQGERAEVSKLADLKATLRERKKRSVSREKTRQIEQDLQRIQREVKENRVLRKEKKALEKQLEEIKKPIVERVAKEQEMAKKAAVIDRLRAVRDDMKTVKDKDLLQSLKDEEQAIVKVLKDYGLQDKDIANLRASALDRQPAKKAKVVEAIQKANRQKKIDDRRAHEALHKRHVEIEEGKLEAVKEKKKAIAEKAAQERPEREAKLKQKQDALSKKTERESEKLIANAEAKVGKALDTGYFEAAAKDLLTASEVGAFKSAQKILDRARFRTKDKVRKLQSIKRQLKLKGAPNQKLFDKIDVSIERLESKFARLESQFKKRFPRDLYGRDIDSKNVKRVFVERRPEDAGKTPLEVAKSRIHQPKKSTLKDTAKELATLAKDFETGVFDKYKPLEKFAEDPEAFIKNAKKEAEWIDAAESQVKYMLEVAQFNYVDHVDIEGSGLIPRMQKVFGKSLTNRLDIDAVAAAASSIERQNLGMKNNIPTEDAVALMGNARLALAAKEMSKFSDHELTRAVDGGIVSADGAENMRDVYKAYAPLYRFIEVNELARVQQGSKSLLPSNPIKRAKGSTKDILSPSESMLKNTIAIERALRKNQVMKTISDKLKRDGAEMIPVDEKGMKREDLQKLVGEDFEVTEAMVDGINVFKSMTEVGEVQKGWIYHFENGKKFKTRVPVELHGIVRNITAPEMGAIEKGLNAWRNFFSRAVVTFPRTALKLAVLDPVVGALQSKHGPVKFLKELIGSGYPAVFGKTNSTLMNDFVKFGGARYSLFGSNRAGDFKSLADTVVNAAKEPKSGVRTVVEAPIQAFKASVAIIEKLSTKASDAPRLAEFKLSKAKYDALGMDPVEANYRAAYDAWEVTVPYGREGAWKSVQLLNRIIPFSRTILTSNQSFFKAIDPRTKQGRATAMAATAALTMPTLFFYLMNRNHPAFLAEDQRTKDENILIYPSLITGNFDPEEKPIKIPHLWQFGFLFQKLPESALEYAINNDPEAVQSLLKDFEYNFSPLTFASLAEGIISTAKSGHTKPESFFQGRFGAAPKSYKTLEPEAQVTSRTSETAKWLSENVPLAPSPIWIDQMVNKIGAGFGDLAMRLADEAGIAFGGAPDRKTDESLVMQHIFGAFIGKGPQKYSSHLKKFYELSDSQRAKHNTFTEYMKLDPEKAQRYAKQNKWVPNNQINAMYKGIQGFAKQIAATEYRASHNAAEKAAKSKELMRLYIQMGELAEAYNKQLEAQIKAQKNG